MKYKRIQCHLKAPERLLLSFLSLLFLSHVRARVSVSVCVRARATRAHAPTFGNTHTRFLDIVMTSSTKPPPYARSFTQTTSRLDNKAQQDLHRTTYRK